MARERHPPPYDNSIAPPVYESASYWYRDAPEVVAGLHNKSIVRGRYGRYDNPSWLEAEHSLAALCEAEGALVFSSGMAAISTTLLSLVSTRASVFFPAESYRQSRNLFRKVLPRLGVAVDEASIREPDLFLASLEHLPSKPDLVHLEMPSSPHMYLIDVLAVREAVGDDTIITMDCSFAPPPNFYPHRWGVDLAMYSGTKYLGGHGDLVIGVVTGRRDLLQTIRWHRDTTGSVPTGHSASLLSRSLLTLPLRIKDVNQKAVELARYLEAHPCVSSVFHTSLETHPHYHLGQKYLAGHGGVITFSLPLDEPATAEFVDMLKVPYMASNFGAPQTLVEQSTFFTYYEYGDDELEQIGVPRNTVRLAIGYTDSIEAVRDDLDRSLRQAVGPPDCNSGMP